nr:MotA/TolQ/ExbB proton channel family protein [Spirochaetota bacterium]
MIAITVIATLVILFFAMYSGYYIWQAYNKPQTINDIFLDSIPGIFTTLGILGTFVGIFIALMNFDVNNITTSIPYLLGGLKTAFLTSILGIIFSLISSRFIENIQHTRKNQLYVDDELSVLKELLKLFADF